MGLSDNSVRSVVRDSIGFIWAGTDGGLYRFNGGEFRSFHHGIASRYIRSLISYSGRSLICSSDDGIHQIQSFPDTVVISQLLAAAPEISDSTLFYPNNLFLDAQQGLWISEPRGSIVRFHQGQLTRYELGLRSTTGKSISSFSFAQEEQGHLWVASQSGYVFRYDDQKDQFIEMFDSDRLGIINHLELSSDGHLLMMGDRIYQARINQNGFLDNLSVMAKLPSEINHALIGPQDQMYFGTNNGIYQGSYHQGFKDYQRVFHHGDAHRVEEIPFQTVRELRLIDGDIWISSPSGVGLMKTNFFMSVENLPMQHIYALKQVTDRSIYASFGELYEIILDPEGTRSRPILGKEGGFILAVDGIADSIWTGNVDGELLLLNRGKVRKKVNMGKRGGAIFFLLMDQAGNLWICQAPTDKPLLGVAKYDNRGKLSYYGPEQGLDKRILVMAQEPGGRLLAAGIGNDTYLYLYHPQSDSFINLSLPLPFNNPGFEVHDLTAGPDGVVWLGTTDGLLRYNLERIELVDLGEYTRVEIRAVTVGGDGSIWASTDVGGVIRYQDGNFVIFDESSGLPSKITTYRTLARDSRDRIWVGTAEGVVPSQMPSPQPGKSPQPIFLDMSVNGKRVNPDREQELPNKSLLNISYTALAYPSRGLEFRTRLQGPDGKPGTWKSDNSQETLIPGLSFGDYSFEVSARQSGGYSWSLPASFRFSVRNNWYQTYYAYAGLGAFALLFLWIFSRAATHKLRKEKNRLLKMLDQGGGGKNTKAIPQVKRLRSLAKLLEKLNTQPGWQGKPATILEPLRKMLPVDCVGMGFADPSSGEIHTQEVLESNGNLQRRTITISGSQNFPVECILGEQVIWIKNLPEMGPEAIRKLEFKEDQLMHHLVYLPLKLNHKTYGYLAIKSYSQDALDEFDIQSLKVLASIIAMNKK